MQNLLEPREGLTLYNAGLPHFPRNFTRDSIISAYLFHDPAMLRDQLIFCARKQGVRADPQSGEDPGKIFHEYPGFPIGDKLTTYNACDTTALFLWGHELYLRWTGDRSLSEGQAPAIRAAVGYILRHLRSNLFWEDPSFSGADSFALRVTYWKDSQITGRREGKPVYPVAYTLAQAQNLAGLRSAGRILQDRSLIAQAERMVGSLQRLWDQDLENFYIAYDKDGPIRGISSDGLQLLFYLEPGDLFAEELRALSSSSACLETPIGYRTLEPKRSGGDLESYHSKTVWPFEQALIFEAARKFHLPRVAEVSRRITSELSRGEGVDPEIYELGEQGFRPAGCSTQLWTIAAKEYFAAAEVTAETEVPEEINPSLSPT